MLLAQGDSRQNCNVLAVVCEDEKRHGEEDDQQSKYPFPKIVSRGRLVVHTLTSPSIDEFQKMNESFRPNVVYTQGESFRADEFGSLTWEGLDISTVGRVAQIFGSRLPTVVYLEMSNGEKVAEAIHSMGVSYVIYWKSAFSCYAAAHFRNAFFSAIQSSPCHTWDAFQLAHASFRLYCMRNNMVFPASNETADKKLGPALLGDPPSIDVALPKADAEDGDDSSDGNHSAVKIHEDDITVRFLVCGLPCTLDAFLLGCLEDGLQALLNIQMRGSKIQNRFSAPMPLQTETLSRGVVTMRCEMSTLSSAHISLLLLENHIKEEVTEGNQLVHAVTSSEDNKQHFPEPRKSDSIACGASVFEVLVKLPSWAFQVLRQLAPDASYRDLTVLGVASINGVAVASFEKDDAERLMFFCSRHTKLQVADSMPVPSWLRSPVPSRKRSKPDQESSPCSTSNGTSKIVSPQTIAYAVHKLSRSANGTCTTVLPTRQKLPVAAMRPIPESHRPKLLPFTRMIQEDGHEEGQSKTNLPSVSNVKHIATNAAPHRKITSTSYQPKRIVSLNSAPLKKHGCGRASIHLCPEEEFLKDLMQFLILRGHARLVPQGGFAEFPDAILNSKRLDLYNLYREVVSRGGFHVGNGINWKGQVFSKMRNYTASNRMTGVGNTLKRHYETYLLEYELAHDDVDGEYCLLCHSGAAGDWVNCGTCGGWAHFGCDRRQGLGAFKDYAKTDGLEYICPNCSMTSFKKKSHKAANGFS
ncbi:AT-rich interactive domain-containing protein [Drosera capensis]